MKRMPTFRTCRVGFRVGGPPPKRLRMRVLVARRGKNVHVIDPGWCIIGLPKLRCLAVQNLVFTDVHWLNQASSLETTPLHSLNLNDKDALQLRTMETLFNMTAFRQLSMHKTHAGDDAGVAGGAAREKTDDLREAGCLTACPGGFAQLAAARPGLQVSFWAQNQLMQQQI